MTEFEINKAVAEKLGVDNDYGTFTPLLKYSFDPCNNVEQAWEIMMKYDICITKEGRKYRAIANMKWDGNEVWCSGAKAHKKTTRRSDALFFGVVNERDYICTDNSCNVYFVVVICTGSDRRMG